MYITEDFEKGSLNFLWKKWTMVKTFEGRRGDANFFKMLHERLSFFTDIIDKPLIS